MEEVAEGVLRLTAKVLLTVIRFLIWVVWELMCETLLWYVGWPVMRFVTIGNYPKQGITNAEEEDPLVFFFVAMTGLASMLVLAFLWFKFFG
jgi:hypothetical protein